MNSDPDSRAPRVVIVGGGFAGLRAARVLGKEKNLSLTLVDRRNHHLFQPLLYQVATAVLEASSIAMPLRSLVGKQKNTEIELAEVESVEPDAKLLRLGNGRTLPYDYLIIATGATHSFFGRDEWAAHTLAMKTVEDALDVRRRVLLAFELAEHEPDPQKRERLLTFVLIGAGPTGVEMAGALAEVARHALKGEFKHIQPASARILLVEAMDRVLPTYPEDLSAKALRSLQRLGVDVRLGEKVTNIDETGISIGETRIPSATVVWAAGVAASPLARTLGAPLDRAGRVQVTGTLQLPEHPEIFVVGDLAAVQQDGKPVPGIAPAALQMGKRAAENVLCALRGKPPQPFRYWDRGYFAVIGRGSAVGVALRSKMAGFAAWLGWLFIHIAYLTGFRSRVVTLVNWAYSFFTLRRGVRLIMGSPRLEEPQRALRAGGEEDDAQLPDEGARLPSPGRRAEAVRPPLH